MAERILYLNGSYINESEAKLSIHDRGFLLGDAAYDMSRTFNHRPFKFREHIARLYRSLEYIQIDPGLTLEEMLAITHEVFKRNEGTLGPKDDFIVIQRVSRGVGEFGMKITGPTVLVYCHPVHFSTFARRYVEGAHLVVASTPRTPSQCLNPRAKLQNKLNHIVAELESKSVDPSAYVLMLDTRGYLAECTAQNLFLVRDGKLFTPTHDTILEGVSRETVQELALKLDIPYFETDLDAYDLSIADEVFLTSNTITIMPVSKVNGRPRGKPVPGPVTERLLSSWSELVGVDIVEQALAHTATPESG